MRNKYALIVALFFGGFTFTSAIAQNNEDDFESRLIKLENINSKLPQISGQLNLRYQYRENNDVKHNFDVRRARIDFKGAVGSKFDYRAQIEFAGSNVKLLDGFVKWKPVSNFFVQGGQYKLPFSIENQYSPYNMETIDYSLAVNHLSSLDDISGINSSGRDVGIMIGGNFFRKDGYSIIEYSLGLFNGNGINRSDNNSNKDFSGLVYINPIKYFSLAVSHYNGNIGDKGESIERVRTGYGLRYDDKKIVVRSEYIHGKTGELKSKGVYILAGYTFMANSNR
ncbi:MAG: OprO/OprP family phosphate-selective porin [Rikenellaceae bacterium]|nr:OprO/OprP family phosphate-selective porin [Rikenellaceae bacterium]